MAEEKFSNDQFESIYPDGIENHYWNHARNHIIYRCLKQSGLTGEQLLEIGAGRGVVTKFLHDKGINITGVELSRVRPVEGAGNYFLPGTDAFELSKEFYKNISVILLLDVIEHIEFPILFLNKILTFFPNLKYILITVPARHELWSNYDEFNGHFMRYNLHDINNLRTDKLSGYFKSYFFHILYPLFYVYSKLIKNRETEIKAPVGYQVFIHRFLSFLLRLDFRLMPGNLYGTSILALFKMSHDPGS